jgi:hypothetical protein
MSIERHLRCAAAGLVSLAVLLLLFGCGRDNGSLRLGTIAPDGALGQPTQSESEVVDQTYQKAKDEALAAAQKDLEARKQGAPWPPSMFPFPNTPEPEQQIPDYLNFYSINDRYPMYLLCEYRVDKKVYDASEEAGWFKAALEQIRKSGPTKFPPIKWVAVIIVNRAEWNGVSTYEQAHKVGAIFKASDVFSPSCALSGLVSSANTERHPFKYDPSQPTPGDQDRWLIVEQHASATSAVTNSSERMVTPAPQP